MDAESIAARLDKHRRTSTGWQACCPSHQERTPSLSITDAPDGRTLIHCFAGCSAADIMASMGLSLKDLFPPSEFTPQQRKTYRQKASRTQLLKALYHELLVLLQVVEKRVCDAELARDKNYLKHNPQFKPMPPEWWDREIEAAKRVKRVIGDLYGN